MTVEAPLSHGQLYSWREVESYLPQCRQEANLATTWDLRGHGSAAVTDALHRLAARHEALRTTYHLSDSVPVQRVHDDVALPLEHVDMTITGLEDVERTTAELMARPFAMTGGLCWRALLVSSDGAPAFVSVALSHLIVDVWSVQALTAEFGDQLRKADVPVTQAAVTATPRELALRQREHGQRAQDGTERYWRQVLAEERLPDLPSVPAGVQQQRIQLTLHSPRLGVLLAEAAQALGVTVPAVLASLAAAGLGRQTGAPRVALSLMSSNRFRPEHRHVVGTLNQLIPVVGDVDLDVPLAEHVTRWSWAGARAYRHASYDVDRIRELVAGAGRSQDGAFTEIFPCWFNYVQLDDMAPDEHPAPAELSWTPAPRPFGQVFDVRVSVSGGSTAVAVRVDPQVLPADALVELLRAIARGTALAVSAPSTPIGELWSGPALPSELFPTEVPAAPAS